ncbi:protein translocase subunit SecD [Lyngbya confervoides]|uniref:Protein translocase subunit SecD n=1 Tax=Lyngbya confervoides BDU141951 TaxID=1574623 RepID=A0ABD4SYU9_9CYAN|nr:protein translocase subunit SecD [Lyngbya confervoides]MCM1981469.1 protein translocase subunit SecD [Lyngbya confervoides BDU141951]
MGKQRIILGLIAVLVLAALYVLLRFPVQLGLDLRGGSQLLLQVQTTEEIPSLSEEDLQGVKQVVENRVNEFGVSETVVQVAGNDKILVQLPGVNDPKDAERILKTTAQLEFRTEAANGDLRAQIQVREQERFDLLRALQEASAAGDPEAIAQAQAKLEAKQAQVNELTQQLYEKTGLTGKYLKEAFPSARNQTWDVALRFDAQGADLFAQLTQKIAGTGRTLGIFLDGRLISSPVVGAQYASTGIVGGTPVIEGNFTFQTANELAVQLRGGALPLPIKIVENRTVGATLGQDSIRSSIVAGLVGLGLVLAFMVVYYRLPGVFAAISLSLYTLWTFAIFMLVPVTLTLPGIAGFILSIGMAVDANVLIFERTREELRAGKTLYRSVESGFSQAFSSILDSNLTTLIACAALYWLGSGLVKGFALTLAIGICVSMFTAVTCSRTLMLFAVLNFPGLRNNIKLFYPGKIELASQ